MKYYFLIAGSLCILYYMILVIYSRRLRSTFAAFWLVSGGVHLVLGCAPLPVYLYAVLRWLCLVCWGAFLFVEVKIVGGMRTGVDAQANWIIILGAQVRGTYITSSLRRRLDAALCYLQHSPETKVIVSGGQGPGEEISEADAMAGYLEEHGIPKKQIFRENRSASTRENLRFSREYVDVEHDRIGIVTNDFHIYRSSIIARQEGYRKICRIPADSDPVFRLNYMVREFFGVIYVWIMEKK